MKRIFIGWVWILCVLCLTSCNSNKHVFGSAEYVLGIKYKTVLAQYDHIGDYAYGYAIVNKNDLYGIINTDGEVCIEPKYAALGIYSEGLIGVKAHKDDLSGYMNIKEKMIIPAQYQFVYNFHNGIALVAVNQDSIIAINKKGVKQWDFPKGYTIEQDFSFGRALVSKNGKYTYITQEGVVLKTEFESAGPFFCQTAFYTLPFPVAFATHEKLNNIFLISVDGCTLSTEEYHKVADAICYSDEYLKEVCGRNEDPDKKHRELKNYYSNNATNNEIANLLYGNIAGNDTHNSIIWDDSYNPSMHFSFHWDSDDILDAVMPILIILLIIAYIVMIIHMIVIRSDEKNKIFKPIAVQQQVDLRRKAGLPEYMTDEESFAIDDVLTEVYNTWSLSKINPNERYPMTKEQIQRAQVTLKDAIDKMPTNEELIERINAWGEMMNTMTERIFVGSKPLIIFDVIFVLIFGAISISSGGMGLEVPIAIIVMLAGYILSAYEPGFIAYKKEQRNGGRRAGCLAAIFGSIATGFATAKTYKTITTYGDGHTETRTDDSETWIQLVFTLIITLILAILTGLFALFNYLRNYVLYK